MLEYLEIIKQPIKVFSLVCISCFTVAAYTKSAFYVQQFDIYLRRSVKVIPRNSRKSKVSRRRFSLLYFTSEFLFAAWLSYAEQFPRLHARGEIIRLNICDTVPL